MTMKLRIECYDESKPTIVVNRYYNEYYEDPDYFPDDDDDDDYEEDEESEYDPDEEQISDSEDGSDYEPNTDDEQEEEQDIDEDESLKEPTPYYGRGFTIHFDSHEDKRDYFKNLNSKK